MKKFVTFMLCAAMLAGGTLGVSANDYAVMPISEDLLIMPAMPDIDTDLILELAKNPTQEQIAAVAALYGIDVEDVLSLLEVIEIPDFDSADELAPFIQYAPLSATDKVLVLGDSNACGYLLEGYTAGAVTPTENSFGAIIADSLLMKGQTAAMYATPGATADDVLDLLSKEQVQVEVAKVSSVVLNIGGNDLIQGYWKILDNLSLWETWTSAEGVQDLVAVLAASYAAMDDTQKAALGAAAAKVTEDTIAELNQIVAQLQALNPKMKIFIIDVPDVTASFAGVENEALASLLGVISAQIDAVNEGIEAIETAQTAKNKQVTHLSLDGIEITYQADGIHFSPDSHKAIGEALAKQASKAVKTYKVRNLFILF
ncbi:MAG: SGNH/GDSL hydrolase family protein [Clostridia bacterium]|nr:SGNH/GDSL hydrolase family protein [Clostridia bacterium]